MKLRIPQNVNAIVLQACSCSYALTVSNLHCKIGTASPQERRGWERAAAGCWNARRLYTLAILWRQAGINSQAEKMLMQRIEIPILGNRTEEMLVRKVKNSHYGTYNR